VVRGFLTNPFGRLFRFSNALAEIRLEWKRKRNFMKLLDSL
jgi:hypothetical protein